MYFSCPLESAVGSVSTHSRYNFRMMVWLVSYYEFYDKKVFFYGGGALFNYDFLYS